MTYCVDTIIGEPAWQDRVPTWGEWLRSGVRLLGREALRVTDALAGWRELSRQRHRLMTLDGRMLADIGITRADVHQECQKHFWQFQKIIALTRPGPW